MSMFVLVCRTFLWAYRGAYGWVLMYVNVRDVMCNHVCVSMPVYVMRLGVEIIFP